MDTKLIEDQVQGLQSRLAGLKATEKLYLQASGIEGQVAQARAQQGGLADKIEGIKAEYDGLLARQASFTQAALAGFLDRMNQVLPEGEAFIELGEKAVSIGWTIAGVKRPIQALSGGERVAFDAALAHALGAGILVKEVAELDDHRLELVMQKLMQIGPQVILATCHAPATIPAGWTPCPTP